MAARPAAPTPVAALVTANVTGSTPPAVAAVTPQEFELARRNLTEAVAPSVPVAHAPEAISLQPSDETTDRHEVGSGPAPPVNQGEDTAPCVASSPCSPSSPPGVEDEVSTSASGAKSSEGVQDAADASPAKRDAEGFVIDENYAKEQLQEAVVDAPPPTTAAGS